VSIGFGLGKNLPRMILNYCSLFCFFDRDFLNGIYRPFLHHEIFTNDDVRAKVQQIESLGDTWIYVLITVCRHYLHIIFQCNNFEYFLEGYKKSG